MRWFCQALLFESSRNVFFGYYTNKLNSSENNPQLCLTTFNTVARSPSRPTRAHLFFWSCRIILLLLSLSHFWELWIFVVSASLLEFTACISWRIWIFFTWLKIVTSNEFIETVCYFVVESTKSIQEVESFFESINSCVRQWYLYTYSVCYRCDLNRVETDMWVMNWHCHVSVFVILFCKTDFLDVVDGYINPVVPNIYCLPDLI